MVSKKSKFPVVLLSLSSVEQSACMPHLECIFQSKRICLATLCALLREKSLSWKMCSRMR